MVAVYFLGKKMNILRNKMSFYVFVCPTVFYKTFRKFVQQYACTK